MAKTFAEYARERRARLSLDGQEAARAFDQAYALGHVAPVVPRHQSLGEADPD